MFMLLSPAEKAAAMRMRPCSALCPKKGRLLPPLCRMYAGHIYSDVSIGICETAEETARRSRGHFDSCERNYFKEAKRNHAHSKATEDHVLSDPKKIFAKAKRSKTVLGQ